MKRWWRSACFWCTSTRPRHVTHCHYLCVHALVTYRLIVLCSSGHAWGNCVPSYRNWGSGSQQWCWFAHLLPFPPLCFLPLFVFSIVCLLSCNFGTVRTFVISALSLCHLCHYTSTSLYELFSCGGGQPRDCKRCAAARAWSTHSVCSMPCHKFHFFADITHRLTAEQQQ